MKLKRLGASYTNSNKITNLVIANLLLITESINTRITIHLVSTDDCHRLINEICASISENWLAIL